MSPRASSAILSYAPGARWEPVVRSVLDADDYECRLLVHSIAGASGGVAAAKRSLASVPTDSAERRGDDAVPQRAY